MDGNLLNSTKLKEDIENCIIRTNSVINRWITINNVNPKTIHIEDVQSIFFGYLRKVIIRHANREWKDWRRASKNIYIMLNDKTKFITNVMHRDIDTAYYNNKNLMSEVCKCIDSIDYIELQNKLINSDGELTDKITLDLSKIEEVTF